MCVGKSEGKARFNANTGTGTGHIAEDGNLSVDMISIDSAIKQGIIQGSPNVIKIDVEGAEKQILEGAMETIKAHKPRILLAVHSDEFERGCRDVLELSATFSMTFVRKREIRNWS